MISFITISYNPIELHIKRSLNWKLVRNEWKMKVEFIFLPLTLVSAQYGYAQPGQFKYTNMVIIILLIEFIGDLSNVLKEFRHSNSYPLMDGPRDRNFS